MTKNDKTENADLVYLGKPGGKVFGPYTQDDIAELKQSGEYADFSLMWDPETRSWLPINLPPAPVAGPDQDEFPFAASPAKEVDPNTLYDFGKEGEEQAAPAEEIAVPEKTADLVIEKTGEKPSAKSKAPSIPKGPVPKAPAVAAPKPTAAAPAKPAAGAPHAGAPKIQIPPAAKAPAPRPPIRPQSSFSLAAGAKQVSLPLLAVCHDNHNAVSGSVSWISPRGFVLVTEHDPSQLPPFHRGGKVWMNLLDDATGKSENIRVTISDFHRRGGHWEFQMAWDAVPTMLANAMPPNS